MTIFEIYKTPVIAISAQATLQQAAILMDSKSVGCLVVIDAQQVPIGLVTDRDIVIRGVAKGTSMDSEKVESVVTKDPIHVSRDTDITEVIEIMRRHRVRRVLVTNEETKALCGILSADDVLATLATQIEMLGDIYFLQDKVGQRGFETDFTKMA